MEKERKGDLFKCLVVLALEHYQEPMSRGMQLHYVSVTAFS